MSGILDKFKDVLGFGDYDDDFDEMDEYDYDDEDGHGEIQNDEIEQITSKQKAGKVLNIHNSSSAKVMVIKPTTYEESREIADAIKNRKIVLVNTNDMETKVAQRLIDFISGSCWVLGAQLQDVEQRVYLLSPSNVEVTNELKSEISSKALFNWNKS